MSTLYLIRGLPGTGKTTLARQIGPAARFEADQYFTNPETGEYKFDASQLSIAHGKCLQNTRCAMNDGRDTIIVSNTFSQRWEMKPYYEAAEQFHYTVIEITITGIPFNNIHNVPQANINAMRERWEK